LSHGICKRWLVKDSDRTIGRIAAFINYEKNKNTRIFYNYWNIGFFESMNDEKTAFLLFDTIETMA